MGFLDEGDESIICAVNALIECRSSGGRIQAVIRDGRLIHLLGERLQFGGDGLGCGPRLLQFLRRLLNPLNFCLLSDTEEAKYVADFSSVEEARGSKGLPPSLQEFRLRFTFGLANEWPKVLGLCPGGVPDGRGKFRKAIC